MRAPALLVALPLLTGTSAAILLIDSAGDRLGLIAAAAALLALVAATGASAQEDTVSTVIAIGVGSLLAGVSLGTTAAARAYDPPLLQWFRSRNSADPAIVEGVLREDAAPRPFGVSLLVDVMSVDGHRGADALGGIRVSVGGVLAVARRGEWRAGRTIRAPVLLRRPPRYLNPGVADDTRALARRGIVLVGTVKSASLVEVLGHGSAVAEACAAIRARVRRQIDAHVGRLDIRSAGIATAVLIGDRSGLSEDDERRLQDAGTYHVIAISGGNIALLTMLLLACARGLAAPPRVAAVVTVAGLVGYSAVTVGSASVERAVTVAVLILAARAMDHRAAALNVLAIAAIAATAAAPVTVLDPGFLLSFGATAAILLGVPVLVPRTGEPRRDRRRLLRRVRVTAATLAAATLCAEAALAPIGATLFGRVPLAGLLLNFAAIPLMSVVQTSGLFLAVAGSLEHVSRAAGMVAHVAANGLFDSARLVQLAPWLTLSVPPPAAWLLAVYYAALLFLLLPAARRAAAVVVLLSGIVMIAAPRFAARDDVPPSTKPVRVVFLDVGQGDSTVVSLPLQRTLLVDGGGIAAFRPGYDASDAPPGFDVGARVVAPALQALRVRGLHATVLTHGDPDHLLGIRGVLREVRTSSVWEGVPVPPHPGLRVLAALADVDSIPWRTVQSGDRERFGIAEVRVLHPPPPDWERQRVRNEDSVVLEIRIGLVSIVLPGDIGPEGERAIVPRLEPGRLVILKAPHHGSATSSTQPLVDRLRPAVVIFSCGRDNRFGHPHPTVLERYRAAGAVLFSTAEDGAVFVETDGEMVDVRGWAGRRVIVRAPDWR